MMRWYTAVGGKMEHPGGLFVYRLGRRTKYYPVWKSLAQNALLWSFVEETQIYGRMVQLLKGSISGKGSGWENRKG